MSLTLPENPNLEYLRKQAKQIVRAGKQPRLADAQRALANEYGFPTWAKLKTHIESSTLTPAQQLKAAIHNSDADGVRALLTRHPQLKATVNEPLADEPFGTHALFAAVQRSDRETVDVLLEAGADINQRTHWWAGGFGLLDDCDPSMLGFLTERGAVIDAHAAARLGLLSKLEELVAADPALVHARGGDGQTPLHFASTVEIAKFLVQRGADIDARDIDHESTPAQYMLRVDQPRHFPQDRQDIARYLVSLGCKTDILMAAALGDLELIRRHLDADPSAIRMIVSQHWFPKQNPRAGGTIYIWTLGRYRSAHTVARDFGHEDAFQLLLEHTPDDLKLALACELGDEAAFREFMAKHPDAVRTLSDLDKQKLPDAAQSNNVEAVRLMLEAGWPVDTPGEMGATALHWAAFNGNADIVRVILPFGPALEAKSKEYSGTALSWAIFGSGNSPRRKAGDYVSIVRLLLDAGAAVPPNAEDLEPSDAVLELLP